MSTDPAAVCHICGKGLLGEGEPWCSVPHGGIWVQETEAQARLNAESELRCLRNCTLPAGHAGACQPPPLPDPIIPPP